LSIFAYKTAAISYQFETFSVLCWTIFADKTAANSYQFETTPFPYVYLHDNGVLGYRPQTLEGVA
jgi:hypothetical protein